MNNISEETKNRMNRNAEFNGLNNQAAQLHNRIEHLQSTFEVAYWIACQIAYDDHFDVATVRSLAKELAHVTDNERANLGGMRGELYRIQAGIEKIRSNY